jgi:HD-GYP domain-containing protein (c-di-GMP phosphodiesterase class II)
VRRLAIEQAEPGMVLGRAVMAETGEMLLNRGIELTERYVESLHQKGYSSVVIEDTATSGISVPEIISTEVRAATTVKLRATFASFQQATGDLRDKTSGQIVRALRSRTYATEADRIDPYRTLIDDIRAMLDDLLTVDVLDGLNAIKIHADYLFQHSIDVTIAALMIGKQLKLDARELRMLALGCLMHDTGKTLIDQSIIQKPGKLTRSEWAKVKTHPQLGYLMLRASGAPHDLLAHHVAFQHHERQDGQGYPRKLLGLNRVYRVRRNRYQSGQILLIAEIAAVANVYEALATRRPYRPAYPHEKIPEILRQVAGSVLNAEIVEEFLKTLPLIPTGTEIEVIAGRHVGYRGVVARVDRAHLEHPWIRLTHDAEGRPVDLPDLDLLDQPDLQIRSAVPQARAEAELALAGT